MMYNLINNINSVIIVYSKIHTSINSGINFNCLNNYSLFRYIIFINNDFHYILKYGRII